MSGGSFDTGDGLFPAISDDLGDGLAEDLRARVKSELEPGERLLWVARSVPPPVRTGKGSFIAFGIGLLLAACGVLVIFRSFSRPRFRDDSAVDGLLLTLLGAATVIATILVRVFAGWQRVRQAHSYYAVTDRRAISWIPEAKDGSIRVRSLGRGRIQDIARVERPDGTGTLEFFLSPANPEYPVAKEEFKHIPEVRRVEQIVRNNLMTPEKGQ